MTKTCVNCRSGNEAYMCAMSWCDRAINDGVVCCCCCYRLQLQTSWKLTFAHCWEHPRTRWVSLIGDSRSHTVCFQDVSLASYVLS